MPRVHGLKKKYMQDDLHEWIVGRMQHMKKSQDEMGQALDMTQPAFSWRLKDVNFTWKQLLVIFKELEATDEIILKFMKL